MRGLAPGPPHAYLCAKMRFFQFLSPTRAYRDLRLFLATRKKHELYFMLPALGVTMIVIYAFVIDTVKLDYQDPEVIYVKSWPLTRSESEIRAQQIIDQAEKKRQEAELQKQRDERQQQFKKVDDRLRAWGI
jgi:hypothetical protein